MHGRSHFKDGPAQDIIGVDEYLVSFSKFLSTFFVLVEAVEQVVGF